MIKDQIADQLVYSTVRIVCRDKTTLSRGTGFFMRQYFPDKTNINAIVTNNHVVDGYDYAEITLAGIDENGMPDDKNHVTITINDLQKEEYLTLIKILMFAYCLLMIRSKNMRKQGNPSIIKLLGLK